MPLGEAGHGRHVAPTCMERSHSIVANDGTSQVRRLADLQVLQQRAVRREADRALRGFEAPAMASGASGAPTPPPLLRALSPL